MRLLIVDPAELDRLPAPSAPDGRRDEALREMRERWWRDVGVAAEEAIRRHGARDAVIALLLRAGLSERAVAAVLSGIGGAAGAGTIARARRRTWAAFP